jgi:secondary thiamine-phosphate synthase enzyme
MVKTTTFTVLTDQYNQFIRITDQVEKAVAGSGVKNGMVTVLSKHTTTGITVNESLECLESDIDDFLRRLVPEDWPYAHARMLKDYGSTAGNPTGHLKSHITGNHCHFIVVDGKLVRGGAQEVYFCEFDGPAQRTVCIQVMGDN